MKNKNNTTEDIHEEQYIREQGKEITQAFKKKKKPPPLHLCCLRGPNCHREQVIYSSCEIECTLAMHAYAVTKMISHMVLKYHHHITCHGNMRTLKFSFVHPLSVTLDL